MDTQSNGYLTVFVTTAREAIPIENAMVRISGEGIEDIVRFTDKSGKTERVPLPAPAISSSEAPNIKTPFYTYQVSVYKEGFYTQRTENVPVFPTVSATQSVNLIGLSEYNSDTLFPMQSTVTVKDNPQVLDRS